MGTGKRNTIITAALYLAVLGLAWIWFHPYFVSERVQKRISIGALKSEVERVFQVRPYDFPSSAYSGKDGPPNITRIAIDETGRVPLLPIPMVMVTTTIFCFDRNDKLVGMKTERWFDDL